MADGIRYNKWKYGRLTELDEEMDRVKVGKAIAEFVDYQNKHKTTQHLGRILVYAENILFSSGRQYLDGVVGTRIRNDSLTSVGNQSEVRDTIRNIPRPTNDILGRYIEPNISLLTENKPKPRITAKSDRYEDAAAAELSELTMEYLWEALKLPMKTREIARIAIHCGVCWLELFYDNGRIRRMKVPQTREEEFKMQVANTTVTAPVKRQVQVMDEQGRPVYTGQKEFGDIVANIVTPFELHFSNAHWWEDIEWVIKEEFLPIEAFRSRYSDFARLRGFTKRNGWNLDELDGIKGTNVQTLPVWWWERLSHLIEGSGPNFDIGTEEQWSDYVLIRTFDRKPNEKWPNGRTVIVANDTVIYDSPKKVGARVYDPRWPERWHPYIRYSWEGMVGNIYGRSLVSKLIPKVKRINTIDTAMIMWRRSIPYAGWLVPRGSQPIEGFWKGGPARIWDYDPSRTHGYKPEPITSPSFPEAMLREREMQLAEMDMIAGTEEVLRGARPVGTTCWLPGSYLTDAYGLPVEVSKIRVGDRHSSLGGPGPIGASHSNQFSGEMINIKSSGNIDITVTPNHKLPVIPRSRYAQASGRIRSKTSDHTPIILTRGDIQDKYAGDLEVGDLVLSGFVRPRDGIEKIDIDKYGGAFKEGSGGTNHGRSKLTDKQIDDIRHKISLGVEGRSLSREYCVSEATISRIKNGRSYTSRGMTRGVALPPYVELNDDVLWLIGIYLAEGMVGRDSYILWTTHEDETDIVDRIIRIVEKNFGITCTTSHVSNSKARRVFAYNAALARLFKNLFGTGSSKKYIHPDIFSSPRSLLPVVAGWLDGDGWLNRKRGTIVGDTTSKSLLSQVRSILLDEKIWASIFYLDGNRQKCSRSDMWKICVPDPRRLAPFFTRLEVLQDKKLKNHYIRVNSLFATKVKKVSRTEYSGPVYNVTMDEREGCDNSVNSFGLYTKQSSSMLAILRKQVLASRSPIIQGWDESHEEAGSCILQEVIKHVRDDPRYLERIRILTHEKHSRLSIQTFSGTDLSDNVHVRVDTASLALASKEAREAKALEFLQYAPALMSLPLGLRQAVVEELGFAKGLTPQGPDVDRAKRMISLIRQEQFDRLIPLEDDEPYTFVELLVEELKSDSIWDYSQEQIMALVNMINAYKRMIQLREEQMMRVQLMLAQAGQKTGREQEQMPPLRGPE